MMRLAGRLSVAASLVAGMSVGFAATPAMAQDASRVKELYEAGMNDLEKRDYESALDKFKALFQEDPSQDQVIDLIGVTETRQFLEMLKKGGEYELAAKRLLELGHLGAVQRSRDTEAIGALVDQAIKGSDLAVRRQATRNLVANHGAFAVPSLVRYLGSNDTDERVRSIMVLEDLGLETVLPLVEVLNSPDAQVRQNVVVVLKRFADPRAYPILEYLAGAPDQPATVREEAQKALHGYADQVGLGETTPIDAFLEVAYGFYRKLPEVLRDLGGSHVLWYWDEGQLKFIDSPALMYHLRLAEKACGMALQIDPASSKARAMLSVVYAAQKAALESAPEEFKASPAGQMETARLAMAEAAIQGNGIAIIERGIMLANRWDDADVSVALLRTLAQFGDAVPTGDGSALVASLGANDQRIQWEAALTALRIAPAGAFPRCELVVPLAADAVSLASVRQVLIIEPMTKTAVQMQTELNGAGMNAVVARNGADGLIRAKQGNFDAILVSTGLVDVMTQQVVNEIRRDARTASVPVMVMAPEASAESVTSLYGDSISGVVSLPTAAAVHVPQVKEAASASPLDDRAAALAMSERATAALAAAPLNSCFDLARAEKALVGTLNTDKPDSIKTTALTALHRFGTEGALKGLMASLTNDANSEAVRAGSARVIGRIITGKAPTQVGYETLIAGLGNASIAVRTACAGALGAANLTDAQRAEVLMKSRL